METLGQILWYAGLVIELAGAGWFVVVAFQQGKIWGVCSLLVFLLAVGSFLVEQNRAAGAGLGGVALIVAIVFLFKHWNKAALPFVVLLLGGVIAFLGLLLQLQPG